MCVYTCSEREERQRMKRPNAVSVTKKKTQPSKILRIDLHLLDDSEVEARTTLLTRCLTQQCKECQETLTKDTLSASHGRMVVIDLAKTEEPKLVFCTHCAYFYARARINDWRKKSTKLGAPLTRQAADEFIGDMCLLGMQNRHIVVILP